MNVQASARLLTDVSAHHLGTVFAHCLQVVDLALQEGHLRFQLLLLQLPHAQAGRQTGATAGERDSHRGGECV